MSEFAIGQPVRILTTHGTADAFTGRVGIVTDTDELPDLCIVWVEFPEGAREGFPPEWLRALTLEEQQRLGHAARELDAVAFPRFLLFAGSDYYPAGGVHDYRGAFESLEAAVAAAEAVEGKDWWQVAVIQADGLAVLTEWPD